MAVDLYALLVAFVTIVATIFIIELTDKDALLLLTLATRIRPWTAFAAGATAFTITSAIIVAVGYFLIHIVPIFWIRLVGGLVMVGFGISEFFQRNKKEDSFKTKSGWKTEWSVFFSAVSLLVVLDLAGDATEVLTIVYVARFSDALLVFLGAVTALVAASALETLLGQRIGKLLSAKRIRYLSIIVFIVIGTLIVLTTLFPNM